MGGEPGSPCSAALLVGTTWPWCQAPLTSSWVVCSREERFSFLLRLKLSRAAPGEQPGW